MTDINLIVGKRIRELRQDKRWTQEQLAEYADLHVTYIVALEKGRKNASIEVLYRIANAFEISLADFFDCNPPIEIKNLRSERERNKDRKIEILMEEYTQKLLRMVHAADED